MLDKLLAAFGSMGKLARVYIHSSNHQTVQNGCWSTCSRRMTPDRPLRLPQAASADLPTGVMHLRAAVPEGWKVLRSQYDVLWPTRRAGLQISGTTNRLLTRQVHPVLTGAAPGRTMTGAT
jgi:hypothetical protein